MWTTRHNGKPRRQRGFTLLTAIFLVVILSALGTFLLNFTVAQHLASALDLDSERAYLAARAGGEYGAYQLLKNASPCPAKLADLTFADGSLDDFVATVECTAYGPFTEGGGNPTVFRLLVTACNRPLAGACPGVAAAGGYAERQLRITLGR